MKKLKEIKYSTLVPLYTWARVQLVLTNDMRATEDKHKISENERGQAHTITSGSNITVLIHNSVPLNHVAHEAVHVATYVLKCSGIKSTLSNDEAVAYVVDWFVTWVMGLRSKR